MAPIAPPGKNRRSGRTLRLLRGIALPTIHGNAIEVATAIDSGKASTVELNVLRSAIAEEVTRILFDGRSSYRRIAFGRKSPLASRFSSVISIDNSRSSELRGSRPRPPETGQFHLRPNGRSPVSLATGVWLRSSPTAGVALRYGSTPDARTVLARDACVRRVATPSCCRSTHGDAQDLQGLPDSAFHDPR